MTFKTRPAKVEILFKAPGLSGNGMQCTAEGIWTIDNAGSRTDTPGRCKVYLSSYEGKQLRELSPEGTGPSGLGVDETTGRFGSARPTAARSFVADAKTGETIEKHFTPGAGVIYRRTNDIPARPDTYGQKARAEAGIPAREVRPRGGGEVAARPASRSGRARDEDRTHPMAWAWVAAERLREIPGLRRRELERTAADSEREAVDVGASGPNDLSRRSEDLDRRAHVSDRRVSPARHRHRDSRCATSLGIRHQHGRLLQARHGDGRDRGRDHRCRTGHHFRTACRSGRATSTGSTTSATALRPVCRTKI